MKTIETAIDIDAPPETVWEIVTDFARYGEWNPFMTIADEAAKEGNRLHVTIRPPNRKGISLKPTVTTFEPGHSLRWLGHLVVPGIFDGAHELTVEPRDGGGSRFLQRETFKGALIPFTGGMLRDTAAGFEAMNTALKQRAEALK
jgi:hypothetical protein